MHWPSLEQAPQVSACEMPQSWPVGQSDDGPWQSPDTQPPLTQTVVTPYALSDWQAASPPQAVQECVGWSHSWPPLQSCEVWQLPATQTLPMQTCWGPYAVTQTVSLAQGPQVWVVPSQISPPPQSEVAWQVPDTQAPPMQRWLVP